MGFITTKYYVDQSTTGAFTSTSFQKTCLGGAYPATAGRWYDLSTQIGYPAANMYPQTSPLKASSLVYTSPGNIWHGANVSPMTKHLVRAGVWSSAATFALSTLVLCDYLIYYPLIRMGNGTDIQTFDNSAVSLSSIGRYTDGTGVQMFLVVTGDCGPIATSMVIDYQNSAGVDHQVIGGTSAPGATAGTWALNVAASSFVSTIATSTSATAGYYAPFIPLAPGDNGVRKVNSIQLVNGMANGWCALVLVKPLAYIPLITTSVASERDYGISIPSFPRIYDGAYLNLLVCAGGAIASGAAVQGYLEFAFG